MRVIGGYVRFTGGRGVFSGGASIVSGAQQPFTGGHTPFTGERVTDIKTRTVKFTHNTKVKQLPKRSCFFYITKSLATHLPGSKCKIYNKITDRKKGT